MSATSHESLSGLLAPVLAEERFWPSVPHSLEDTGLSTTLVESLILKHLCIVGCNSGRGIAQHVCLPFAALESLMTRLADTANLSPISARPR